MSTERRHSRIHELVDVSVLQDSRLVMLGVGAMGASIAESLVRHGVATGPKGQIVVVDNDIVELHNLVRCPYLHCHERMPKVEALENLLLAIDPSVGVRTLQKKITPDDVSLIADLGTGADLVCDFTGDSSLSPELEDACYDVCPVLKAHFSTRCDMAEVGFSVPGQTIPLSQVFGKRRRRTLDGAEALGVDTSFVTSFVAALCLRLLALEDSSEVLPTVYSDAPLFLIGLRRVGVFESMPIHMQRAIYLVGEPADE